MSKPKKRKEPKQGSTIETVLAFIIENYKNDEKIASSYTELSKLIYNKTGKEINRRRVCNAILRFNEGLFEFKGKNIENFGKIDVISKKKKRFVPKKKNDKSNKPKDPEDEDVLDLDKLQEMVKGGSITNGWFQLPSGEKVNISRKKDVSDEDGLKEAEEAIKQNLKDEFWDVKYVHDFEDEGRAGVVFITDIHIGSLVEDLVKTPDFNTEVVKTKLLKAAKYINEMQFDSVHVMCLGDVIESYTGLNHKNTWKGLEIGAHGPEVVKLATKILHEFFFSQIDNLAKINMIAGNHCRTTQSSEEEVQGGVSNLVAWGLELMGYNVLFDPLCLTVEVDDIAYILLHGDKGISKRPTKEIIWDRGIQHKFNFVAEGHLHSRIQKLTANAIDKFQVIKDDSVDCRRQIMPSIFTGNSYSDDNNWFSQSGFVVVWNNGEGKPITLDIPL